MKYIFKIYSNIFKWMPFSAAYTAFDYLYGAFIPAVITLVTAGFFDCASRIIAGEAVHGKLYLYAGLYFGFYFINDFSIFFRSITLNAGIYEKGTAYFRIALYEKLAKLPLSDFENAAMLDKKERAEKAVNDEVLSSICNHTMRFARSVITVISVAAVLSRYSLWLLPLSLITVFPYLVARLLRGKEFYHVKHFQAKKTRRLSYLWELFTKKQTAKEMRVMGFGGYITEKWRETRDEVNEELWKIQKKDTISLLFCDALRIAGYGASVAVVLFMTVRGDLSIGVFGAAIAAFLSLQNGMQNILENFGRFPEQLSYAKDYYSFFDMPEENCKGLPYKGLVNEISLRDVSFKYPGSTAYALRSVNLSVRKGEKVAIIGENGSGKTTLVKIMLGLYRPESGRILYDETDIENFDKDGFYNTVSAISQDFVSYSLTLRENVAISDISRLHDDEAITESLKNTGADNIGSLNDQMGLEFGGKELSGGQWQKLAIARGLFKESELIVLDEPTGALDPLAEADILTDFINAAKTRTALIISHRVGLCKLVDRIIVMKNGEIAEIGSHDELYSLGGEYARLYTAQEKWYRT